MKSTMTIIALFAVQFIAATQALAEQDRPVKVSKTKGDPYTNFIEHAQWPEEAAIRAKRVDAMLVTSDVYELQICLTNDLRAGYAPTVQQMQEDVIACVELRNSHDYLLLRYSPKESVQIEVQDGPAIFLTVTLKTRQPQKGESIGDFVKTVAAQVLNYPGTEETAMQQIDLFVSSIELADSKCGTLTYGPNTAPPPYWYSHTRWWSDGRKVLFLISRLAPGEKRLERGNPPPNIGQPRRFHFRKNGWFPRDAEGEKKKVTSRQTIPLKVGRD